MPESVLRFTEADKQRAAEAIYNLHHPSPGFRYMPGSDRWAYDFACAALDAALNEKGAG